jgi:hypothetical protein
MAKNRDSTEPNTAMEKLPKPNPLANISKKIDQLNGWVVYSIRPWIKATHNAVLAVEGAVLFGIGATLMQISEWLFAICAFIVLGFLLLAKSFSLSHWMKVVLGSVCSVLLAAVLIAITVLHKPEPEPWSNLQKLFHRAPPSVAIAIAPKENSPTEKPRDALKPTQSSDAGSPVEHQHTDTSSRRPDSHVQSGEVKEIRIDVKGSALDLEGELWKWVQPRLDQRLPIPFTERGPIDAKGIADFHAQYDDKIEKVIKTLQKCGANTGQITGSSRSATQLEDVFHVMDALEHTSRDLPVGHPECGTAPLGNGFTRADTDMYTLSIGGGSHGSYLKENGFLSERIGDGNYVAMYLKGTVLCVDVALVKPMDQYLVKVSCNQWKADPSLDVNFTDKAIEVVTLDRVPILQIIYVNPTTARVNGLFQGKDNTLLLESADGQPLRRIFKYPSWQHLHEYADQQ